MVAYAVVALSDMLVEVVAILWDKSKEEVLVIATSTALALGITNPNLCKELGVAQLAPLVHEVPENEMEVSGILALFGLQVVM